MMGTSQYCKLQNEFTLNKANLTETNHTSALDYNLLPAVRQRLQYIRALDPKIPTNE
jgi:hypothetical protein